MSLPRTPGTQAALRERLERLVHRIAPHGERSKCGFRGVPMAPDETAPITCQQCRDIEALQ